MFLHFYVHIYHSESTSLHVRDHKWFKDEASPRHLKVAVAVSKREPPSYSQQGLKYLVRQKNWEEPDNKTYRYCTAGICTPFAMQWHWVTEGTQDRSLLQLSAKFPRWLRYQMFVRPCYMYNQETLTEHCNKQK